VNLKKYLYILRPALCIAWVRERTGEIPPMSLPNLMAGVSLEPGFRDAVSELLARKTQASEVGFGQRVGVLDTFIQGEWLWASEQKSRLAPEPALRAEADAMFRDFLELAR
jgi:hypothetical protein